jgi:preprotein translocase SecE subunit
MANTASAGGEGPRKLPTPNLKKGGKRFFADVGREMKKVDWPARSETNRLTGVVLAVCAIVVAILSTMGWVFEVLINLLTAGGGS